MKQSVDALALRAEEGRGRRRNASGSCQQALIRRYPNGETPAVVAQRIRSTLSVMGRQVGELKHLSTRKKRNQKKFCK